MLELLKSDIISEELSNSLLILMVDIVFNVSTNQEYESIQNLNVNGALELMLANFENGMLANDYDNLGFLIQISSRLLTHLGNDNFPKEKITSMVIGFLNRILSKKQVCFFAFSNKKDRDNILNRRTFDSNI